jgi:O-methyltransferase domain/Dimerisation domain
MPTEPPSPSETPQSFSTLSPQIFLLQMIMSNWIAQSIYAAAKLGIADRLQEGAKSCDELAKAMGTNSQALYRLLRALASVGIFAETDPGWFALTPLAAYLQSDIPGSLRDVSIMIGDAEHYRSWGNIMHSLMTGESAFEKLYGMNIFQHYAQNPESAAGFDRAMTSFSSVEKEAVVSAYDFSSINTLVDVAGGEGSLLVSILLAYPQMQGILFDQPEAIERAKLLSDCQQFGDRCQLISGNFFESLPSRADAYILKHILHDWDDDRSIAILKICRQAMTKNSKLLVVEMVIPPGNKPSVGKLLDMNMLIVSPGGKERTEEEYHKLFELAGFKLTRIVPTNSLASIVEGIGID